MTTARAMMSVLAACAAASCAIEPEPEPAEGVIASAVFTEHQRYQIVNAASGRCMDVENASTQSGANVNQFTCHGGQNQVWRIERTPECSNGTGSCSYNLVRSMNSNLCLEVAVSGRLHQAFCSQVDGQRFIIWEPLGSFNGSKLHVLQRKATFQCLDVENASYAAGARINAFGCSTSSANQIWLFQTRSNIGV